jgi:hypothetical protein
MATYRIVCVDTEYPHRHILAVGTGDDPDAASARWTTAQVRSALADGDRFFTVSPSTEARAEVRRDDCPEPGCTFKTIRSDADAVTDNNLDNLRACSWKS